jgi:hypothetical protein
MKISHPSLPDDVGYFEAEGVFIDNISLIINDEWGNPSLPYTRKGGQLFTAKPTIKRGEAPTWGTL